VTPGHADRSRRLWRLPPFTAYLLAVSGWFFGFGLQTTLFPGVINYTLQESPERLGMAQAALTAPMLFLLPLAGVLAERFERRKIMFRFQLLAVFTSGGLAALLLMGQLSYPLLVIYALITGTAGAFMMPARDSAVNPVTRATQLMGRRTLTLQKAVIIASLVQFAAQIAGMATGFLAGLIGPGLLFIVQAAGLLIGALSALLLPRLNRTSLKGESILRSLSDGVRAVTGSNILAPMTLVMMAVGCLIVGGGFFVIVPTLVRDAYGGGYGLLAFLLVAFWVGAFMANVVLARIGPVERPGRALMLAQLVTVISMGLLALPMPLPALFALVFAWGMGGGVAISLSRAVVQENAPRDKVARVMSVYQLGLFGGMPVGAFFMGFVVAELGPRLSALVPMAGLFAVLAAICVFTPILKVQRVDPD
jgi:MFS family permease